MEQNDSVIDLGGNTFEHAWEAISRWFLSKNKGYELSMFKR